jgi:hypothetical protein
MHLKVVFFLLMSDGDNITLELKSNLSVQTIELNNESFSKLTGVS